MPTPQGLDWLRSSGSGPWRDRDSRRDREDMPWYRPVFWPPNAAGGVLIALVASVVIGFLGALIYTQSETGKIEAADPVADLVPEASLVPAPDAVTSTTKPVSLSPEALTRKAAPSVWSISTLDDAGRPVQGAAFVSGSSGGQSFLLTSLAVVRASTRVPGPGIVARNGGTQLDATLWTWQEERDLALLVIPRTAPSLKWGADATASRTDDKVYGAAASGGVIAGAITGVSAAAIEHNIFTDDSRQGGPLLNDKGEVLGMLSHDYDPGGTGTDRVFYAVPIRVACERVLRCGAGNATPDPRPAGAGPAGGTTTTTRRG